MKQWLFEFLWVTLIQQNWTKMMMMMIDDEDDVQPEHPGSDPSGSD